jgi:adenylate cyclase
LEGVAALGAICPSQHADRHVKAGLYLKVRDLDPTPLKNIAQPIRVYSLEVVQPATTTLARASRPERVAPRPSTVVVPFAGVGGRNISSTA